MLLSFPLEGYVRNLPLRPDFQLVGTGHARGYVATWELRSDDSLWLTGLQTRPENTGPDGGLRVVFPQATGPIFASWASQLLHSPDCQQRRFNPFGGSSTYAHELVFRVWAGQLISSEEFRTSDGRRLSIQFTSQIESIFGSEESAFLRAIARDPLDSAPRLIFADWLEEREDPRSDLIRVHERLRALGATKSNLPEQVASRVLPHDHRMTLWKQLMGYDDFAQFDPANFPEI